MDVRLPNGKIIKNVPEGTTRGELMARARQAGLLDEPEQRGSAFDPIMQGLTFGWADELGQLGARLGRRLAGAPEERIERAGQQELERQRADLAAYRERNPLGSMALELGGSLVTGAPMLKGLMAAGQAARLGQAGSLIGAGTAEGALAGAGAAEDEKLLGAATGGLLGLGLSGAVPAVGYAAKRGAEFIKPTIQRLREEPTTTAGRILSEQLESAGITPALLRARQRQLGPEAMFADIAGPAGTGLGQQVIQASKSGKAVAQARREMTKRAAGSTKRLREDIAKATGIKERLQPSLDAVRARQKAVADKAYRVANAQEIPLTPKLKNILNRPPMQKAFKQAKKAAETRGEELPPFFKLDEYGNWQKEGVMPDMPAWDRMKQGIDRLIDKQTDEITGRVSAEGRDLTLLKNELLGELDKINKPYRVARQLFAGDEAIQQAMRKGEKFLTMKTRDVQQHVKNMKTGSEREAFLTGAVESIREKMGRARAGEIGEFRFLETGNAREKLRAMFPAGREGDKQMGQLLRTLRRERTFATTQGDVIGGSQTALRQAAGRALETGAAVPTTTEMITSPIRGTAQAGLQKAGQALSRVSDKSIEQLGQMLFDPNNVEAVITEMQRRGIPQQQITQFVNRFSLGSAALSPYAGTLGGRLFAE